jgi:hypothetical protein
VNDIYTYTHIPPSLEYVFLTRFFFFLSVFAKAVTGKEFVFGYDTYRRPALYMVPSRQNTKESPRQIQFAFWMLERALDLTGPGVE